MKENNLITTNNLLYKIKNFLTKIFHKNKINYLEIGELKEKDTLNSPEQNFRIETSYKIEMKAKERKERLANQLLTKEKVINELTEYELDEMIEYFRQDIEEKEQEISQIKAHIIAMRKQCL